MPVSPMDAVVAWFYCLLINSQRRCLDGATLLEKVEGGWQGQTCVGLIATMVLPKMGGKSL